MATMVMITKMTYPQFSLLSADRSRRRWGRLHTCHSWYSWGEGGGFRCFSSSSFVCLFPSMTFPKELYPKCDILVNLSWTCLCHQVVAAMVALEGEGMKCYRAGLGGPGVAVKLLWFYLLSGGLVAPDWFLDWEGFWSLPSWFDHNWL